MGSEVIDYILLALIFAIIINILTKLLGSKCKGNEHMDQNQVHTKTKTVINTNHNDTLKVNDAVSKIIESKKKCPVNKMEDDMKFYMKEVLMRNRENYGGETFDNNEILDYQNNFFSFNNKINHSSSNEVDMVDKLNEGENYKGKKIADIFNDLTQSNLNKRKN